MNTIATLMTKAANDKGWLAISNAYFDNGCMCNVYNTLGYLAVSESQNLMFWQCCADITDSNNIENIYIHMDPHYIGHQQTIMVEDLDCLQHFEFATYAHWRFYWNDQKNMPLPTFPTPASVDAMVKDADTGLYADTDTICNALKRYDPTASDGDISTILLYTDDQFADKPTGHLGDHLQSQKPFCDYPTYPEGIASTRFASGINIDNWKMFNANQKKFAAAMKEHTGIADIK